MRDMAPAAPVRAPAEQPGDDHVQGKRSCLPGSKVSDPVPFVASPRARAHDAWRIRDIDLVFIIRSQLWATTILTVIPVAMMGVVHWGLSPNPRPFFIYDARISYPEKADSIPAWVSVVVPFFFILTSLLVGECVLFKEVHRNITMALSTVLHFFIDLVLAFLFTTFLSEVTKMSTGVLRPDFLQEADCQLPAAGATLAGQPLAVGTSATQALASFPCRASQHDQNSARSAFISGHAASTTVFALFNCGYCFWCLYYRQRHLIMRDVVEASAHAPRQCRRRVWWHDFGQALAIYWVLLQICFGWGMGLSRIVDFRHHPADVVGGFMLGAVFGTLFVLKAIPTAKYVIGQGPEFEATHSLHHTNGNLELTQGPDGDIHATPRTSNGVLPPGQPQPVATHMV